MARPIIPELDTPAKATARAVQARCRANRTPEQIAYHKAAGAEYARQNREEINAKMRAWRGGNAAWLAWKRAYAARPDVVERRKARAKAKSEVRRQERQRAKVQLTPEQKRERNRRHQQAWLAKLTPEQVAYQRARYRAKEAQKRGAAGKHTAQDILRILKAQRGKCAACHCSIKSGYHVDHIQALSRGGSNWPKNLQLLCEPCNLRKKAKDPIEFMQELGRLL